MEPWQRFKDELEETKRRRKKFSWRKDIWIGPWKMAMISIGNGMQNGISNIKESTQMEESTQGNTKLLGLLETHKEVLQFGSQRHWNINSWSINGQWASIKDFRIGEDYITTQQKCREVCVQCHTDSTCTQVLTMSWEESDNYIWLPPWHTFNWLLGYHLWFLSPLLTVFFTAFSPSVLFYSGVCQGSVLSPLLLFYQTLTLYLFIPIVIIPLFFITVKYIFAHQIFLPNSGLLLDA